MATPATLLNTPSTATDWDRYSFDLDQNIKDLQQALRTQRNVALPAYQIFPISADIELWLERVSAALGEITAATKVITQDVESVDLNDVSARQAWVWSVYSQVRDARATLKI